MTFNRYFSLFWLLPTSWAVAQQGPPSSTVRLDGPTVAVVQQLGKAFVRESPHVGLSIGIVRNGQTYFYNFGETNKDTHQVATAQTRYELASTSKTFASLLLAQAVVEQKVKLTDDICQYLPGQYPNLAYQGRPIRLIDLADLTSGLPNNLPELAMPPSGAPPDSIPFRVLRALQHYSPAQLYDYLHTVVLTVVPGASPQHSNVAAQVLGCVLANVYHTSYAALLQRYIEHPLGMGSGVGPATVSRPIATGYNEKGQPMPLSAVPALQAVGGLTYGTAEMLKYVAYQLAEKDAAVRLSHQAAWGSIDQQAIGLNWDLNRTIDGQRELHTSGSSFGFASYCDLYPELHLGVVLLTNQSDPTMEDRLQGLAQQVVVAIEGPSPALQALQQGLATANFQHPFEIVQAVKKKYPRLHLTENYVNNWGGGLMQQGQLTHAVELFKLNVRLFPGSWNTYDSLGGAYAELGERTLAIENYQRSVALNPQNTYGVEQLKKLQETGGGKK